MGPAQDVPVRDATSLIVLRGGDNPSVLMGRRLQGAVFMPGKHVFPGGRVDEADADVPVDGALSPACTARLGWRADGRQPAALVAAGIRELYEETGLVLGRPGTWADPPAGWVQYADSGHRPYAGGLSFVFRAVTPPGRPRRFDARFFAVDAGRLSSDPDDFSGASGELADLAWIPLAEAGALDLAIVTREVLAAIAGFVPGGDPPERVTYMMRDSERLDIPAG